MDYTQRIGMNRSSPGYAQGGSVATPTVGGSFGTQFGVQGSATGPAFVLIGLVVFLVLDYVWTKGQQGGR